jgi:hypothetical protein
VLSSDTCLEPYYLPAAYDAVPCRGATHRPGLWSKCQYARPAHFTLPGLDGNAVHWHCVQSPLLCSDRTVLPPSYDYDTGRRYKTSSGCVQGPGTGNLKGSLQVGSETPKGESRWAGNFTSHVWWLKYGPRQVQMDGQVRRLKMGPAPARGMCLPLAVNGTVGQMGPDGCQSPSPCRWPS